MIEVVIDSIRVSLMSQNRVIVLKDPNSERFLPIWIGSFEAEQITVELQELPPSRPMTHDLLKAAIESLGGDLMHILISDLRKDIFYARLVIDLNGKTIEVDARSSDAIAIAVRFKAPIFVAQSVMDKAAITPDEDIEGVIDSIHSDNGDFDLVDEDEPEVDESKFSAFADFVNSLDLDDLDDSEEG